VINGWEPWKCWSRGRDRYWYPLKALESNPVENQGRNQSWTAENIDSDIVKRHFSWFRSRNQACFAFLTLAPPVYMHIHQGRYDVCCQCNTLRLERFWDWVRTEGSLSIHCQQQSSKFLSPKSKSGSYIIGLLYLLENSEQNNSNLKRKY
jgi:hypothetical protein